MKSILIVWKYFRGMGVHPGLSSKDIRITRLINQFVFTLLTFVLLSALTQVVKYLYLEGRLLTQTFLMLVTFGPLAIIFYLNQKGKYYTARLIFIGLPMITTMIWMIVDSSQSARIHYSYLLYPIPIVFFFKEFKTQLILIVCCTLSFIASHYIAINGPLIHTNVDTGYFEVIIVVIWIGLSFSMLRFYILEIDYSEKKLREKNLELEEFSRLASHDMREPLRTIGGFSSLVKTKYGPEIDERGNLFLDHISNGVNRMDNLLEDLSNYSMIDHSNENLSDIDLDKVLLDVKNDLRNQIEKTGAEILNDDLPTITAKASHMRQLFQNLITNGIKFQAHESQKMPKVNITCRTEDDFHNLTFSDNGIGIKNEYLDQIFLRFKRLHSKDKYEGTGLGLATCKRIVEYYNGKISIESKVGEGTQITVQFMR